ncbi:hypothetical protein HPB52_018273 [Rhipicephalus sanguineus]|uniref:Fe2OG dioxygenase domain-containing protein n=1 Tax=Rhipicephalus sanguineus TaxID=34632 RepID=A0A9D4PKK8_RHISA|nr:hypothetical protein HPB52_018273 [Rhipicephalus sanguineus]
MLECMGTENMALEDVRFYVLLQEHMLAGVISDYESMRTTKSLKPEQSSLGTFLFMSRLTELSSYASLGAQPASLRSLPGAFLSPTSRQWWPEDSDVAGASVGICKLQHLYDISVAKMASMKSRLLPAASAEDFTYVARGCLVTAAFGNTSAWIQAALSKTTSTTGGTSFHGLQLGLGWLQANDERWSWSRRWAKSIFTTAGQVYPSPPEIDINMYKNVCVQEGFLRPSDSRLQCKMSTNFGDPRLLLQPLKLEVLSLKPRVVVISDFMSSSELSWLWDSQHKLLEKLSRRIEVSTGLSLESAEAYQVSNYGLAGHYTPHLDASEFDTVASQYELENGNRLATVLMYLSSVAAGGATAFVELGVAVKPRVGDALFWYDVEPYDGSEYPKHMSFWHQKRQADPLTTHVGCPVLWGSKWIVTKWIHERSNVVVKYSTPG